VKLAPGAVKILIYGQKPKGGFMKGLRVLLFVGITVFLFVSCVTMKDFELGTGTIATVPYSVAKDSKETAEITFITNLYSNGSAILKKMNGLEYGGEGIQPISIDGEKISFAEKGTVWNPVTVQAGKPLTLTVNIYYYKFSMPYPSQPGLWNNADITFDCPSLEAGKKYSLDFIQNIRSAIGGGWSTSYRVDRYIVLTDLSTNKIVYKKELYIYIREWEKDRKGNW